MATEPRADRKGSLRADDQIVAMNHLGASAKPRMEAMSADDAASDFLRILGVISAKPATDLRCRRDRE